MIRNKKGLSTGLSILIVMGIVLFVLIAMLFVAQTTLPIIQGTLGDVNVVLQEAVQETGDTGLINASQSSFQPATDSLQNFEWITYTVFIFLFITFIIMAFYVRTYPFLIFIWIIMIIILLFASIFLTVAYQDLAASDLGVYYSAWENSHWLVSNLPIVVLAIGIIGGIVMFILASREQEAESIGINYGL